MEPLSGGIGALSTSGPERRIEDQGTGLIESGGEINLMGLGANLMAKTNEDFPPDIGAATFPLPPVALNPPPAQGTFGYSIGYYVRISFQILKSILAKLSASEK